MPSSSHSWIIAGAVASLTVSAAPDLARADDGARDLAPLVVTPARTAQTVDESLASVSVIDRETIERSQVPDLPALLQRVAGVNVHQQGGLGKQAGVSLRGASTGQTLVLIDGVRAGSATTGQADLQHIPLGQIERVEVVRGPRSALYGSDAVGGVIQVFTQDATEQPSGSAGLRMGSERTREVYGSIADSEGPNRYRVSASSLRTRGFDSQVPVDPDETFEPDDDGYRQDSIGLRWGRDLSDDLDLAVDFSRTDGDTEFDGTPDQTELVDQTLASTLRMTLSEDVEATLRLAERREERTQLAAGEPFSQFDTRRREASWQAEVDLAPGHGLVAGFDWRREDVDTDNELAEDRRTNRGLFARYAGGLGDWSWSAALREDDDDAFGRQVTGDASVGVDLTRHTGVFASYGTAFNAPSFNDLYWPAGPFQAGNPDLEPEESEAYELGFRHRRDMYFVRGAVFHTEIDDQIDWDTAATPMQPRNIEEVQLQGAELEGGVDTSQWTVRGALTALDAEDRDTGERLDRRPPFSGSVEADRHIGAWSLGAALEAASYRYDGGGDKRLSGYGVVDLRAAYRPTSAWTLRMKVENVGDKTWYPAWSSEVPGVRPETYYTAPERRYFVGADYRF